MGVPTSIYKVKYPKINIFRFLYFFEISIFHFLMLEGRADARTGGRADGRTDGRADGRTGGRTGGRTDGRADVQAMPSFGSCKRLENQLDA